MWAIPTGISSVKKKKKKSTSPESRVPEIGSDPPIGSGWDSGCDKIHVSDSQDDPFEIKCYLETLGLLWISQSL